MELRHTMTQENALQAITKTRMPLSFGISTDFGVADITKKEALRMIATCERDIIRLSFCAGRCILEYPE